jgi:hypothetical protein
MADKISAFLNHFLHHAPNDMLTVLVAGIGIAAIAIAVLGLLSTTRGGRHALSLPFKGQH